MSKQSKKERKAAREAHRAAVRRAERQRNLFTLIVIGIVVAIGGVLVWVSLTEEGDDELADLLEELEATEDATADERPVACGAAEPEGAGGDKPTFEEPEQVLADGEDYRAVVDTSCGRLVVELDGQRAPENTNSFVFLAQQGFFDGLEIFRHAAGIDALQAGAGTNDASWQVGYTLPDELDRAEAEGYPPGTIAMANAGPDSAGSQFFFVYGEGFDETIEAGTLEPAYTSFGSVVDGLDVLERIADIPVEGETPQERVYMERVVVLTGDEPLPSPAAPAGETPGASTAVPTPGQTPTPTPTEELTEE